MTVKVCETAVENQVVSTEEKSAEDKQPKKPKCKIKMIEERCKGCTYCIEFCPKHVLTISEKINSKGYHIPAVTHPEACISCKLCELICPDFCIFVEKTENNKS